MIRFLTLFRLIFLLGAALSVNGSYAQGFGGKSKVPAASSDKILEAMKKAETAHDLQRDFPGATAQERDIIRASPMRPIVEEKVETRKPSKWQKIFGELFLRILQFIGWGLLTLFALGLIYFAATSSGVWQRQKRKADIDEENISISILDIVAARDWLREAEVLATAGRYGEAVHFLLFRSFQDLSMRLKTSVRPAWTSREILNEVPLKPSAISALTLLVNTVERSEFAGREIYAHEFEQCRADYQRFVQDIAV
jgi:hypothetical protein